jgi:hypothetical protein
VWSGACIGSVVTPGVVSDVSVGCGFKVSRVFTGLPSPPNVDFVDSTIRAAPIPSSGVEVASACGRVVNGPNTWWLFIRLI